MYSILGVFGCYFFVKRYLLSFKFNSQALLYVAAEDEAFLAYNREMDARSLQNERQGALGGSNSQEWDTIDAMPLAGKTISQWLEELDAIAKEVQAELVSRDIGCHLVEVLEAVNIVLFESRGFKRSPVIVDSKCSYMHSVLSSGRGSGKFFICFLLHIFSLFAYNFSHSYLEFREDKFCICSSA